MRIVGRMKGTLQGRKVAILIADGSDAATTKAIAAAVKKAGGTVAIVAP